MVGRKKLWEVRITLPLSMDLVGRITLALDADNGETRLDFIREAIQRELKRRKA